jgi:hypothetical protein
MIRVCADILFLDGLLAGAEMPGGYSLSAPDMRQAVRYAVRLARMREAGEEVVSAINGTRCRLVGRIEIARPVESAARFAGRDVNATLPKGARGRA